MLHHQLSNSGSVETMSKGKFLELLKEGRWEYVQRINANGAVMIIAVTPEDELLLVEEYRVPLHAYTVGLPAGISGDEGEESALESAQRELLEEAGYSAAEWTYLLTGPSSPGLTTEMVSFFLARKLTKVTEGGGVEAEDIRVHRVPLAEVEAWLAAQMQAGKVVDPKIYLGLYFLMDK